MTETIARIRALLGRRFVYEGAVWQLIEVLEAEDCIVLSSVEKMQRLQSNQYGSSARYSPRTLSLPLSDESGENYSTELLNLLSGKQ